MTDFLLQLTLSNVAISTALAGVAYAVHRHGRYPALAHVLWLLVLVKLVTPPLLTLPVIPSLASGVVMVQQSVIGSSEVSGVATAADGAAIAAAADAVVASLREHGATALLITWVLGSVLVLSASLIRIARFDRLLRRTSTVTPMEIRYAATVVAQQIGLRSAPSIYMSSASLSPMTWWSAGRVRVILPSALVREMGTDQLRWVIAHELAHVKRRDHLVRWLEWLALVSFWWNPVVWFARRNLRLDEEVSCDALVLERLGGQPRSYAGALLTVVEFLAGHTARPPAMASGIDAGGSLERRFVTIVSDGRIRKTPRWLAAGLMSTALMLMTLGVGYGSAGESFGDESPLALADEDRAGPVPAILDVSERSQVERLADEPEQDDFMLLSASVSVGATRSRSWNRVFVGTAADDSYQGSRGRDKVIGKRGADDLSGGKKRDLIRGGKGADTITGGEGRDKLIGGPGRDTISGGDHADLIRAGAGRDDIDAGAGDDIVKTWRDGVADTIDCGAGDHDRAVVDRADSTVNCEVVEFRDPS